MRSTGCMYWFSCCLPVLLSLSPRRAIHLQSSHPSDRVKRDAADLCVSTGLPGPCNTGASNALLASSAWHKLNAILVFSDSRLGTVQDVLPEGGSLAIPCSHVYPHTSPIFETCNRDWSALKGADAARVAAAAALGCDVCVRSVWERYDSRDYYSSGEPPNIAQLRKYHPSPPDIVSNAQRKCSQCCCRFATRYTA